MKLPIEKSPLPTKVNGQWDWHKRYFDVGDEITWFSILDDGWNKSIVTKIKANQFGRVSYYPDKGAKIVLMEDVKRAVNMTTPHQPQPNQPTELQTPRTDAVENHIEATEPTRLACYRALLEWTKQLERELLSAAKRLEEVEQENKELEFQIKALQTYGCKGTAPQYPPSYYDDDRA